MLRKLIVASIVLALLGCKASLSPEDAALIGSLKAEQASVRVEIAAVEIEKSKYAGGLLLSLISARSEILKTNDALISQRILAIESGAPVTIELIASTADEARAAQLKAEILVAEKELVAAKAEAEKYSGGLIQAMALSTAATKGQSLAMLQQAYLVAKFGLRGAVNDQNSGKLAATPVTNEEKADNTVADATGNLRDQIITVKLLSKKYSNQDYQDYVFFDVAFTGAGLDKATRAVKGKLKFQDLFGETKLTIGWTIEIPLKVGETVTEKGTGFEYNKFVDSHQWAQTTKISDMQAVFSVESIIYQDGTRRDVE